LYWTLCFPHSAAAFPVSSLTGNIILFARLAKLLEEP
jgi:hypothetical protein